MFSYSEDAPPSAPSRLSQSIPQRLTAIFLSKNWEDIADGALFALLCVIAFALSYMAGTRGFFPFDQSVPFDGGYRVFSGQVPFMDFVSPFPPLNYFLQALSFKVLGVGYHAYIITAAVQNSLATALSILVLRKLFPRAVLLSGWGGLITAAWFYAPFGTPNFEQTGFLFVLLGLYFWISSVFTSSDQKFFLSNVFCGVCLFLALLSKQNVGVLGLLLFAGLSGSVFVSDPKRMLRSWGRVSIGFWASCGLFLAWLFVVSDPEKFLRYGIVIPLELGSERLGNLPGIRLLDNLTLGIWPVSDIPMQSLIREVPLAARLIIQIIYGICWLMLCTRFKNIEIRLAAILGIALIHFQYLFIGMTANTYLNGFGFLGIILGIGMGFLNGFEGLGRLTVLVKRPAIAVLAVLGLIVFLWGATVSLRRDVHDLFEGSRFDAQVNVERWAPLKWGVPMKMRDHSLYDPETGRHSNALDISKESVEELHRFLSASGKDFFMFPDFSIYYGLIGRPSAQPLLFFANGKSYSKTYDRGLDAWIVSNLERQSVKIVVLEGTSFYGTPSRLHDFPLLETYIGKNFRKTSQIGVFEILEKAPAG